MILDFYNPEISNGILTELFHLSFSKEDIPFESTVLPIGCMAITNIYVKDTQKIIFKNKETALNGMIVTGQFSKSYKFLVNDVSQSYGINLHPSAFHKITELDVSKLRNRHRQLQTVSQKLYNQLQPIFTTYETDIPKLTEAVKQLFSNFKLTTNYVIEQIDHCLKIIEEKEGLLNAYDLLDHVTFSQKTLETQFKKIVGVTPGKYIRHYRFIKLMRDYESKGTDLKDLIHIHSYYDHSHFSKDFKYFMNQLPKTYFKSDNAFLNEYLNK